MPFFFLFFFLCYFLEEIIRGEPCFLLLSHDVMVFFFRVFFWHMSRHRRGQVADYGLARTREVMVGAHDRAKSGSKTRGERSTALRAGALRWTAPELLQPPTDGVDSFTEASDVYRFVLLFVVASMKGGEASRE